MAGINTRRKQILMKGFAGKRDVMDFMRCGSPMATQIMEEIKCDLDKENKKTLPNKVPAKRLLPYIHLTENKIFEYATLEDN